jgi:tRNA pseudouridine32 synthase / 23S rRNA pseudouridine746 synthase
MSMPLKVIYKDERLLVIDKPVGLLSVPGIGPEKVDSVATRAAKEHPEGGGARIVHRLDRDTSGVMILALDAEAHRELSRQFHDRETVKKYIAIVDGLVKEDAGRIDLPMRKDMDPRNAPRQVIDHAEGRRAVTDWWVVARLSEPAEAPRTRLLLSPLTGRSHQLRLHLKMIGHPILGDDLYARAGDGGSPDAPRAIAHGDAPEDGVPHDIRGGMPVLNSPRRAEEERRSTIESVCLHPRRAFLSPVADGPVPLVPQVLVRVAGAAFRTAALIRKMIQHVAARGAEYPFCRRDRLHLHEDPEERE